jgi:hypothetical protein
VIDNVLYSTVYEEMRQYLVIEEEFVSHIKLCTIPSSISFLFLTSFHYTMV